MTAQPTLATSAHAPAVILASILSPPPLAAKPRFSATALSTQRWRICCTAMFTRSAFAHEPRKKKPLFTLLFNNPLEALSCTKPITD